MDGLLPNFPAGSMQQVLGHSIVKGDARRVLVKEITYTLILHFASPFLRVLCEKLFSNQEQQIIVYDTNGYISIVFYIFPREKRIKTHLQA